MRTLPPISIQDLTPDDPIKPPIFQETTRPAESKALSERDVGKEVKKVWELQREGSCVGSSRWTAGLLSFFPILEKPTCGSDQVA
jgi:hypothetical protein